MTERTRRRSTSLAARLSVPDWRDLNEDEPFHDLTTDQYCIAVATDATHVNDDVVRAARPIARAQGIANLFKFYNKEVPKPLNPTLPEDDRTDLEMFIAAPRRAGLIQGTKYHLDSRPCSTLRFLVCIDGQYWDSIPNKPPRFLLPIPRPPISFVVNYELSSLPSLLNLVADSLDQYSGEVSSHQDGDVSPNLDLSREAKRLRGVYPSIQKMLNFNGIEIVGATSTRVMQFNFTADYTLDSVGIKDKGTDDIARKLDIGFASFNRTFPMKFVRTRRYVATLDQMKESLECPTPPPWYEFVTEFSHDAAFVVDRFANSRRGRQMVGDVKKIFKDANTVKTAEEAKTQRRSLDSKTKLEQAKKREKETNFVGNLLLSAGATKEVMDSINTSKEAYDKILNKVDLKYLAGVAMRMLTSETAQEDFNSALFAASLKVLDFVELNQVAKECIDPVVFADSGAFDDVDESCPADVEAAAAKIAELVSQGHADNDCMAATIEKICPTPARLFGWRGHVENFLEKNTSTFLAYDRENLCPEPEQRGDEDTPWEIPTIKFPNFPSVTDISMGVWDSFLTALRATTDELIVGIIKEILMILLKNLENILCNWSDLRSFGKERMQSVWDDVEEGAVNEFKSALYDWGINADALLNPAKPGTTADEHITNFMNEVNECLNPGELRAALKGEELGKNSEVITRAAAIHLVGLDPNDALAVLGHAARDVDFRLLDERSRFDVGQYVCDEINSLKFDENFRNSYRGRASDDEIERMLQLEKKSTAEKIGNLASLLNTPYDQMFNDCDQDRPRIPQDPSSNYLASLAVDAQFAGIESNFNQESATYPLLLILPESRRVQKNDPEYKMLFLQNKAAHPEYTDETLTTVTNNQIAGKGAPSDGVGELRDIPPPPNSSVTRRVVLPGLQRSLQNSSGDVLTVTPAVDREGHSNGIFVNFNFARVDEVVIEAVYADVLGFRVEVSPSRIEEVRDVLKNMWYRTFPVIPSQAIVPAPIPESLFYQENYEVFVPLEYEAARGAFNGFTLFTTENAAAPRLLAAPLIQHLQQRHSNFLRDDASPHNLTAQQIMFANYLSDSIASGFDLTLPRLNNRRNAAGLVFNASAHSLYRNSSAKILNEVALLFAGSPLFKTTHENSQVKGLLDINFDPSLQCPPGFQGRDNMLKTNFEKRETVIKYEEAKRKREEQLLKFPDSPLPDRRPLQEASIPSILRSIVRIHVVEIALRSIFGLSRFRGSEAIFEDGALLEFTKDYTAESLGEFITRNTEAFATLGSSPDPLVNFENQLVEAGLGTLEETIAAVSIGVFEEIEKIMRFEYPEEQREDILQTLGKSMGLVPVPESTSFAGTDPFPNLQRTRPAPDSPLRNETEFWGAGGPMTDSQRFLLPSEGSVWAMPPTVSKFRLNSGKNGSFDFQNLEGGYFIFEYFMEFEPLHGADVPHSDVFLSFFENKLENGHIAPAQIENLEAFKEYFKRAVQYYVQQEEVGTVEYERGPADDMNAAQMRRTGINPDGIFIQPTDATIIQDPVGMESKFFDFSVAMDAPPIFVPPAVLSSVPRDRMRRYLSEEEFRALDEQIENFVENLGDNAGGRRDERGHQWDLELEAFLDEDWSPDGDATGAAYAEEVDAATTLARAEAANAEYTAQFAEWQARAHERLVMNPEDPENHPVTRLSLRKLNQYFKSLKYGVRLSYVIPEDINEIFPSMFSNVGGDMAHPNVEELVNENNPGSFDEIAEIKKAYKIRLRTVTPGEEQHFRHREEVVTTQTVCTLPLLEEIQEIPISGPDGLTVANFYGSEGLLPGMQWGPGTGYNGLSRREIFTPTMTMLRSRLIRNNPDFKILFDFALGSTRLTSLLAIYCMQSAGLMNKTLTAAYHRTKKSLIAAMYAAQPDLPIENFYKYQDPNLAAAGGSPGLLKNQNRFASTSGQSGNAAAKTVPFIIKGLAQYQDPSYILATKLDKAGALFGGLGPSALLATAPANIILGSPLPPVTPLGLAAYALGKLPGENVSYDERTSGAQGFSSAEGEQCEEIPVEEDE